jgi:NADPH:quinone reductase-like Zn-dependent oxidoreductase
MSRLGRIVPAIQAQVDAGIFPGAVSLVAHKREVVHFAGTGFIDAAKSRPMSRDALCRLASMTKPIGTVLRSRPRHENAAATAAFAAQMVPLLGRGVLRPITERTFPLEEAQAAYDFVGSDATFGKVVLVP